MLKWRRSSSDLAWVASHVPNEVHHARNERHEREEQEPAGKRQPFSGRYQRHTPNGHVIEHIEEGSEHIRKAPRQRAARRDGLQGAH